MNEMRVNENEYEMKQQSLISTVVRTPEISVLR